MYKIFIIYLYFKICFKIDISFIYDITNVTIHDNYITVFYGDMGADIFVIDE